MVIRLGTPRNEKSGRFAIDAPTGVLLAFGVSPIVFWRHAGIPEKLSFEVVVGQKFVDAPQREFAKSGSEEMRMNVYERYGKKASSTAERTSGPASRAPLLEARICPLI